MPRPVIGFNFARTCRGMRSPDQVSNCTSGPHPPCCPSLYDHFDLRRGPPKAGPVVAEPSAASPEAGLVRSVRMLAAVSAEEWTPHWSVPWNLLCVIHCLSPHWCASSHSAHAIMLALLKPVHPHPLDSASSVGMRPSCTGLVVTSASASGTFSERSLYIEGEQSCNPPLIAKCPVCLAV